MLINNNYVVIMFIDCPGATALFSTSAVCDMCILYSVYVVAVSYREEKRNSRHKNPLVKPPLIHIICIM